MPTSSFGWMIFDAVIALWFFAWAPSILAFVYHKQAGQPGTFARPAIP
jgi:hypothetical protein